MIKINHIAISVTDLQESVSFYRDIIGLKQIPEPFKVGRHAWFEIGETQLHVIRASDERKQHDIRSHICFSVKNMDAFLHTLETHSIPYSDINGNIGQLQKRPDGIRQCYLADPDGYWIEINDDY